MFDTFLRTINDKIKGIRAMGQPIVKSLAFADDCVIAISSPRDIVNMIEVINLYGKWSQAKVNTHKTEVILLERQYIPPPLEHPTKTQPSTTFRGPYFPNWDRY